MFDRVRSTSLGTQYENGQARQTRKKLSLREERIIYRKIIAKYLLQSRFHIKATLKLQSRAYQGYLKVLHLTTSIMHQL